MVNPPTTLVNSRAGPKRRETPPQIGNTSIKKRTIQRELDIDENPSPVIVSGSYTDHEFNKPVVMRTIDMQEMAGGVNAKNLSQSTLINKFASKRYSQKASSG